jgi:hypothetical protein
MKIEKVKYNVFINSFGGGIGAGTLKAMGTIEEVTVEHNTITDKIAVKVNNEVVFEHEPRPKANNITTADSESSITEG